MAALGGPWLVLDMPDHFGIKVHMIRFDDTTIALGFSFVVKNAEDLNGINC